MGRKKSYKSQLGSKERHTCESAHAHGFLHAHVAYINPLEICTFFNLILEHVLGLSPLLEKPALSEFKHVFTSLLFLLKFFYYLGINGPEKPGQCLGLAFLFPQREIPQSSLSPWHPENVSWEVGIKCCTR